LSDRIAAGPTNSWQKAPVLSGREIDDIDELPLILGKVTMVWINGFPSHHSTHSLNYRFGPVTP
jgi:hypothetical protein